MVDGVRGGLHHGAWGGERGGREKEEGGGEVEVADCWLRVEGAISVSLRVEREGCWRCSAKTW